jgi:hypothetical protein
MENNTICLVMWQALGLRWRGASAGVIYRSPENEALLCFEFSPDCCEKRNDPLLLVRALSVEIGENSAAVAINESF